MRLRDLLTWRRPDAAVATVTEASPEVVRLRTLLRDATDRADVNEALLSAKGDPDSNLTGQQAQALFRKLAGGVDEENRDFAEADRNRILKEAHEIYAVRGVASNIIDLLVDFVVGDGFTPVPDDAKNEKLKDLLDEIWTDQRNRLDTQVEEIARTHYLEGERHTPVEYFPSDGHLEFGYMGPERVKRVLRDDLGRDVYLEVLRPDNGGEPHLYFVLDSLNDRITIDRLATPTKEGHKYTVTEKTIDAAGSTAKADKKPVHGLCFSWFENRPSGASRGRSELLNVADYIRMHDELLWNDLEVSKLASLFVLDVMITGVQTPEEAKAKLKEMGLHVAPKGPKVVAHNEKVELDLHKGEIAKTTSEKLEQIVALNIYGAKGMPEHWRGSGADTNLATASAQDVVPMKRLRRKQKSFLRRVIRLIEVSIELRRRAGSTELKPEGFKLIYAEVGGKDKTRGAVVLKDITFALSQAVGDGMISREAANAIFVQTVREVGYELDDELATTPEEDPNQDLDKLQKLLGQSGVETERKPREAKSA